MKSTIRTTAWTAAAMGALLSIASAQDPKPAQNPQQPGQTPGQASKPQVTPKTVHAQPHGISLHKGDRLIGLDLVDQTGGKVGRIDDVILAPGGRIGYVVIQSTVDGQAKLVPIPWTAIRFESPGGIDAAAATPGAQRLTLAFDKERLKTAPSFTVEKWPEGSNTVFTESDTFFRSGVMEDPNRRATTPASAPLGATDSIQRLSRMRNVSVVDASGKPIGTLGQFVMDPMGGRVNYVTLTLTGEGPATGRVVAVPWELFRITREADKDRIQLSVPADKLQSAPQFQTTEDAWKQMSDPVWAERMYGHYSVRPYWESTPSTPREGDTRRPPGG